MQHPETRQIAKLEITARAGELMPSGNPLFGEVVQYPMVVHLQAQYGRIAILKALCVLVSDFCNSLNVVRNMNEDQIIEAAGFLLDECDNFRMEDYLMMFTMAKRGALGVKIMDRVDIDMIGKILDAYWRVRFEAGQRIQEKEMEEDNMKWDRQQYQAPGSEEEQRKENEMSERFGRLAGIMTAWKNEEERQAEERRQAEAKEGFKKMKALGMEDIVGQLTDKKVIRPDYIPLEQRKTSKNEFIHDRPDTQGTDRAEES